MVAHLSPRCNTSLAVINPPYLSSEPSSLPQCTQYARETRPRLPTISARARRPLRHPAGRMWPSKRDRGTGKRIRRWVCPSHIMRSNLSEQAIRYLISRSGSSQPFFRLSLTYDLVGLIHRCPSTLRNSEGGNDWVDWNRADPIAKGNVLSFQPCILIYSPDKVLAVVNACFRALSPTSWYGRTAYGARTIDPDCVGCPEEQIHEW